METKKNASILRAMVLIIWVMGQFCQAQVSMPTSPTSNPSTLSFSYESAVVFSPAIIISPGSGWVIQNSCYFTVNGNQIALYDTSTGSLDSPNYGNMGDQQNLGNGQCSIDLSQSQTNFDGYSWNPSVRVTLGSGLAGVSNQISSYYQYRTCDDYCYWDWQLSTIGTWTLPLGPKGIIQLPSKGSFLSSTSATFTWSGAANALQYCLKVGRTSGGTEFANTCTSVTSISVQTLPHDGSPVYATLTTTYTNSATPQVDTASYKAFDDTKSANFISVIRNTSTNSVNVVWDRGVNATGYRLAAGTVKGGNNLYNVTFPANSIQPLYTTQFQAPPAPTTVFLTLVTITNTGELPQAYVLSTTTSNLPDPRITTNITGDTLNVCWWHAPNNPNTCVASSGDPQMLFYLTVGLGSGSVQIWPGASAGRANIPDCPTGTGCGPTSQYVNTNTSQLVNIAGFQGGRTLYIQLFYYGVDPTDNVRKWLLTSATVITSSSNTAPPPPQGTSQAVFVNTTPGRGAASFQWDLGIGVTDTWLTVGTSLHGTNLYNSYNNGTPSILKQQRAFVESIPDNVSTLYATLYSKIDGIWYALDKSYQLLPVTQGNLSAFRDCIENTAATQSTCTMPAGTYGIDGDGVPSSGFGTLRLKIKRSNITVQSAIPPTMQAGVSGNSFPLTTVSTLVRIAASPGTGGNCSPMLTVEPGVQNVIILGITIDGNNGSYANVCSPPFPDQPSVDDFEVKGQVQNLLTRNITVKNVRFRNSPGRSVEILSPNVENVTFDGVHVHNASLTGLGEFTWNGSEDYNVCDAAGFDAATYHAPNAPQWGTNTQNLTIKNSYFQTVGLVPWDWA